MLKLRVFNTKIPRELEPVEISPEISAKNVFLVGRGMHCDVVLANATVSREHGKIRFEDNQYYFLDLGSTNGSKINNLILESLRPFRLSINDTIHLGDFTVLIEDISLHNQSEQFSEGAINLSIDSLQIPSSSNVITEQILFDDRSKSIVKGELESSRYMHLSSIDLKQITGWTKGKVNLKCVAISKEVDDVKTLCFIANPPHLFTYKPGQFITLELEIDGIKSPRSYSISSSPSRPFFLEIAVKHIPFTNPEDFTMPADLVSNWLYDNLVIGSKIQADGAFGDFSCFDFPSPKLLFLSDSDGIAPLMSMSRWIYDTYSECNVIFFYSARSPKHIIYRQELELMAARSQKFQLAITVTHPDLQESWLGLRGKLTKAMLEMIAPDLCDRTVFLNGSEDFIKSTKSLLQSLDFPMQQYHEEDFSNIPENNKAPVATVVFSKSGQEVSCREDQSILEIAEQAGIKIRNSCRIGNCGSCKKMKLEGEVKMESYDPEALERLEKDAGFILCCISFPKGRVIMEV